MRGREATNHGIEPLTDLTPSMNNARSLRGKDATSGCETSYLATREGKHESMEDGTAISIGSRGCSFVSCELNEIDDLRTRAGDAWYMVA
jgi:hypothetical protein